MISCVIVVKNKKRHRKSIRDRYDYVWEPVNIDKMTVGWTEYTEFDIYPAIKGIRQAMCN